MANPIDQLNSLLNRLNTKLDNLSGLGEVSRVLNKRDSEEQNQTRQLERQADLAEAQAEIPRLLRELLSSQSRAQGLSGQSLLNENARMARMRTTLRGHMATEERLTTPSPVDLDVQKEEPVSGFSDWMKAFGRAASSRMLGKEAGGSLAKWFGMGPPKESATGAKGGAKAMGGADEDTELRAWTASTAQKRMDDIIGGMTESVKATANIAKEERLGTTVSGGFKVVEETGKTIGGKVGKGMEHLGKVGQILSGTVDWFRDLNEQLKQANFRFAEFSGSMAAAAAQQEVRDIFLSQVRGERRAPAAESQAKEAFEMEKRFAVIEDTFANFKAELFAQLSRTFTPVLETLILIGKRVGAIDEKFEIEPKEDANLVRGWLEDATNLDKFFDDHGVPPRLRPGGEK